MFSINGTTIKLTRGDSLVAELALKWQDGTDYEPSAGDSVVFAVKSRLNGARTEYVESSPIISTEIPTSDMTLRLAPDNTAGLAFGAYAYDVEVTLADGRVDTVINNAQFILLPEVV